MLVQPIGETTTKDHSDSDCQHLCFQGCLTGLTDALIQETNTQQFGLIMFKKAMMCDA